MQRELIEFEERLAEYCGVRHAVGVGNATDGLEINLRLAGVGPGDEVILPSHTFVASASAVVAVGAEPVFAEIGDDHLLDPDDVEHRITERTKAVMPTQLNGRTAEMDRIGDIAAEHALGIIEDSAQGLGSRFCGRMAGTFGVAGAATTPRAEQLATVPHLDLRGRRAMAPLTDDESRIRNVFARVRELFDEIVTERLCGPRFKELSLGMTNDFEVGIEFGATYVRIGSALLEGIELTGHPVTTE
jgi:hypothetical protein